MRTKLDDYCHTLTEHLEALRAPLEVACKALDAAAPTTPGRELLPSLGSLRHDLRALADKVGHQQAYVLIFGPLKSGKSTLMNAVAAAYVSEVSSLPAYPCLVFVGAGQRREYEITHYDGSSTVHQDASQLAATIEEAHQALAEAIREAEQQQRAFDPQQHLPSAIRRVDVRLPDSELHSRGAVLVDTPGLYTRMRFGYDRLTRDFRDAAACAVFVVKSDTLFLEQVFAEFDELLDLFSRIFLVVNVDSGKRDIAPNGQLVPSLEQTAPAAVLQAFERLAMPAPLHRAAVEGRLRMYPVDLLRAAATVLQRQQPPDDFQRLSTDLGEFLGSDDYLAAFRRDSLRRADRLAADLERTLQGDGMARVSARSDELERELEFVQAETDLLRRALERDLTSAFARSERQLGEELERSARDAGQKLLRTLGASIDTWFLSGHSLHWLVHDLWPKAMAEHRAEVAAAARRTVEQLAAQGDAGLDLPGAVADLCQRHDIAPGELRQEALAALAERDGGAAIAVPFDLEAIPLKRGILDVVAFRSADAVRTRLFGQKQQPDRKIPAKEKAARLGEPGRLHLHQCVTQLRGQLVPTTVAALQRQFGEDMRTATIATLRRRLADLMPPLAVREAELQRELAELRAIAAPLRSLAQVAADIRAKLPEVARAFGGELARDADTAETQVVIEPARRSERRSMSRDRR